jgi:hypothetical protein
MNDMVRMSPEDYEALAHQMKLASTQAYKGLLDALEPYCDGSMGPVSPAHVNSYLKVRRELNLLWHAYDRPVERPKEGVDEELMVLEARQAAVLAEFEKLRAVGMSNARRRVS